MITDQPSYVNNASGEVVASNTPGKTVIPTQRGVPVGQPAATKGELKPILAPWMKQRTEFASKISEFGKWTLHAALWHLWHAPANVLRSPVVRPTRALAGCRKHLGVGVRLRESLPAP